MIVETSKINDGWDPEASRKVSTYGRYPFTTKCNSWIKFNLLNIE